MTVVVCVCVCVCVCVLRNEQQKQEARKNRDKQERQKEKEEKEALREKYGYATVDGVREKVANYMIEPPGLFRGRGEHPKMGCVKVCVYMCV